MPVTCNVIVPFLMIRRSCWPAAKTAGSPFEPSVEPVPSPPNAAGALVAAGAAAGPRASPGAVLAAPPQAATMIAMTAAARNAGRRRPDRIVDSIALLLSSRRSRAGDRHADDDH